MSRPSDTSGSAGRSADAEIRNAVPSSVAKAFALVEELAIAPGPVQLSELARRTAMTKPTVHRLLRALAVIGYVRPLGSGQYAVGPAMISISAGTLAGLKERPLIRQSLNDIHRRTGLTASYAMRWGDTAVVIDNVEPDQAYRISPRPGVRTPLSDSAAGLAILAAEAPSGPESGPPRDAEGVRAGRDAAPEGAGPKRYAVDTSQPGVCAVAAAVRFGGRAAGALMVTGLSFSLNPDSVGTVGPMLVEQADMLAATVQAVIPAEEEYEEGTA